MKKIRSICVIIGCCLQVALSLGFSCTYVSAYSLLSDAYSVSFAQIGTFTSMMSVVGFFATLTSAAVIKKFKPQGTIKITLAVIMLYGICIKFIPNAVGLGTALTIGGLLTGWSGYYLTNEIVASWFVEKRATVLGIVSGAGGLGLSAYYAVGGLAFGKFGVQNVFLFWRLEQSFFWPLMA